MRRYLLWPAAWLACLLTGGPAAAQSRVTGADLTGEVLDASEGRITTASISATHLTTGVERQATTDPRGRFVFPALSTGTYRVSVVAPGFGAAVYEPVMLRLGESTELLVRLQIAALQQTITVTSAPVQRPTAAVSQVVDTQQIDALPINGRNFISFAAITPGATPDGTPAQGALSTSGLSFAGQRGRSNNIMVDGFDNNDAGTGGVRAVFSQEAIREFQVLASSYSAEFGRASGGVVNIITKSGGQRLSGSVFSYFRDRTLNAADHFERVDPFGSPVGHGKAPFRQHQSGGTIGGPITPLGAFYFVAAEHLGRSASNAVTIDPVAAGALTALGFPVTVGPNAYAARRTSVLGKLDAQRGVSSRTLRINYADVLEENVEPFGGLVARSRGGALKTSDASIAGSENRAIGGRWLNEARAQWARQDSILMALDPRCGGPCTHPNEGGPSLEISGIAVVGRHRLTPNARTPVRLQIVDSVSRVGARHHVKAGVEFNRISSDYSLPFQFGGRYVFTSMAAVLAGTPAAYAHGYGTPTLSYVYRDVSAFVQDEWRVSNRLTVVAGLRYQTQFWPGLRFDVSSINGARLRYDMPQDRSDLAPRVSVSFRPSISGATTLHGAYGVYHDHHAASFLLAAGVLNGSSDGVRTLVLTGPAAQAAWNAPGRQLSEGAALALLGATPASATLSLSPSLETPYARHMSMGVNHLIGRQSSLAVNVLSVRGKALPGALDYNPRVPALGGPGRRPNDINGVTNTSSSVVQTTSFGETWYRALVVAFGQRHEGARQFLLSYTWSSAEDNNTDVGGLFAPQDMGKGRNPADPLGLPLGFDPRADRGPAVWDQRHRFVGSGHLPLPKQFQLAAILTAASGRPFTPLAGIDLNGDGDAGNVPSDRARSNPTDPSTSVGRNSARFPAHVTLDVRLSRRFRVSTTRRVDIEPLVEAFNLLNRVNYSEVNNIFGSGPFPGSPARDAAGRITYGLFTQALAPRQVQIALRVSY